MAHRPDHAPTAAPATCIEYTGSVIRNLKMSERLTVCNMSIEAGARAGMIAPDQTTYDYLRGREFAPKDFDAAVARWKQLPSDPGAVYDRVEIYQASDITPQVTWGTNPGQVVASMRRCPIRPVSPTTTNGKRPPARWNTWTSAGRADHVDSAQPRVHRLLHQRRIEDLRAAAAVIRRIPCGAGVHAMVVPGSGQVKEQAEAEGLDRIFR